MAFYNYPNVYPREVDLSQNISGPASSIAAVVGAANRGPVHCRVLNTNVKDLLDKFGTPDPTVGFMHYSAIPFLSVARQLYVTRVVGTGAFHGGIELKTDAPGYAALSTGITPTAPQNNPSFVFTAGVGSILLFAEGPGAYANSEISVKTTNIDTGANPNTFDIEVYRTVSGIKSKVEVFEKCTKVNAIDARGQQSFVETRINGKSKYIRALSNGAVTGIPLAMAGDQPFSQGANGSTPAASDYEGANGWELYLNPAEVDVQLLLCGGIGVASTQMKMVTVAETRKDCMAILVVPSASQDGSSELTYRNTTLNVNSTYAALYSPDVKINDIYTGKELYVPCDGYVGAVYAYTDYKRDPWYPPAGLQRGIINVPDLKFKYTDGQGEVLYLKQINVLVNVPGEGISVWGQKTLQGSSQESALSRVNVRRLLLAIRKGVAPALRATLFEFNNDFTRSQVRQLVDRFMRRIQARNGVYSYKIICDKTNNPSEVIDAFEIHLDLYIQPQKGAEFFQFQSVITRTDASFNELIATGGNF